MERGSRAVTNMVSYHNFSNINFIEKISFSIERKTFSLNSFSCLRQLILMKVSSLVQQVFSDGGQWSWSLASLLVPGRDSWDIPWKYANFTRKSVHAFFSFSTWYINVESEFSKIETVTRGDFAIIGWLGTCMFAVLLRAKGKKQSVWQHWCVTYS